MRILVSAVANIAIRKGHLVSIFPRSNLLCQLQRRSIHHSLNLGLPKQTGCQTLGDEINNLSPQNDSSGKENDPWQLHRRIVTTSSLRGWSRKPRKAVSFDVGYIDNGANWSPEEREGKPTVVAVHGSPATHNDVTPMIIPFHDRGCRVIAVNLPGYEFSTGVTKEDYEIFSHSTPRIAEFLLDFLSSIDVKEVSMLVAHSGGALPSTVLAVLSDVVKSVMFICPPPGHKRTASMEPVWALRLLVMAYKYTLGKMILRPLIPVINRMTVGLQSDRPSHIMSTLRYVSNIDYALLRAVAMILSCKNLPMLYVCSGNDSLVRFKLSMQWAEMLGITQEHFDEYNSDFKICKTATREHVSADSEYRKGVVFARGGHFPQLKPHTTLPILISEAEKLLNASVHEQGVLKEDIHTQS